MKTGDDSYNALFLLAITLLERGESMERIERCLAQEHEDIILIAVVMKEVKNRHYEALRKQGFRLILLGSILGLSGFLITLINFNTLRSIDMAMYGLTTAGLALVFWGMFKIIG